MSNQPTRRVLALFKYGAEAASTRQRLLQFAPYLAANGFDIHSAPLLGDEYVRALASAHPAGRGAILRAYAKRLMTLFEARRYDVVWLHYELFPYLPAAFERLLRAVNRPVVLDFDDAVFHQYDDAGSTIRRALLRGKIATAIRGADVVTAGNAYLAAYASRYGADVRIIPTVVDTDQYLPADTRPATPVLGWIGSPSTWAYVEPVLPHILPVVARHGAEFHAIGAGPRARATPGVHAFDWTEASEIARVQAMTVGIMPVPDEQWARGKCGYKLIQYMACGLPTLASPVGVNREIVGDGTTGFFAESGEEWANGVDRLLGDPDLCARLGRVGRERAVQSYSVASQRDAVLSALRDAGAKQWNA